MLQGEIGEECIEFKLKTHLKIIKLNFSEAVPQALLKILITTKFHLKISHKFLHSSNKTIKKRDESILLCVNIPLHKYPKNRENIQHK